MHNPERAWSGTWSPVILVEMGPKGTGDDKLRDLHAEMDRAVLAAYGWNDVPTACEFILDHHDATDEEDEGGKKKKKKPYHYRWPDEVRDEVLARLIELNRVRAEDERKRGLAVTRRPTHDEEEVDSEGEA